MSPAAIAARISAAVAEPGDAQRHAQRQQVQGAVEDVRSRYQDHGRAEHHEAQRVVDAQMHCGDAD